MYSSFGTGNSNFGYFAGGQTPLRSTIDRLDYSNDTATTSPKGPLDDDLGFGAGLSSQSDRKNIPDNIPTIISKENVTPQGTDFGYFGGGQSFGSNPSDISTVDRIDYSNDTAAASAKSQLSIGKKYLAATGNGFFRLLWWWSLLDLPHQQ